MFQVIIKGYYEKVRFLLTYSNSSFHRGSSEAIGVWWYHTEQRTPHPRSTVQHNRRIATVPTWHTKNIKLDSNEQQGRCVGLLTRGYLRGWRLGFLPEFHTNRQSVVPVIHSQSEDKDTRLNRIIICSILILYLPGQFDWHGQFSINMYRSSEHATIQLVSPLQPVTHVPYASSPTATH